MVLIEIRETRSLWFCVWTFLSHHGQFYVLPTYSLKADRLRMVMVNQDSISDCRQDVM